MAEFDPDAFLAGGAAVAEPPAFDPDAFLQQGTKPFDPDEFIGKKTYASEEDEFLSTPGKSDGSARQFIQGASGNALSPSIVSQESADPDPVYSMGGSVNLKPLGAALVKMAGQASNSFGHDEETDDERMLRHMAEGVAASKDPLIKQADEPVVTLPKPIGEDIVSRGVKGVFKNIDPLTTPQNLFIAGALPGAAPIIQKAVGAGFAATMAKELPDKFEAILDSENVGDLSENTADFLSTGAMVVAPVAHITGRSGRLPTGTLMPTEASRTPAKPASPVTQTTTMPDAVEGMLLAKEKLGENFFNQTPEVQAERRASVEEIDKQLNAMPPEAVEAARQAVEGRRTPVEPPEQTTPSAPTEAQFEVLPDVPNSEIIDTNSGPRKVTVSTEEGPDGKVRIAKVKLMDENTGSYQEHRVSDQESPSFATHDEAREAGFKLTRQFFRPKLQDATAEPTKALAIPPESVRPAPPETLPSGEVSTAAAPVEIDETMAKVVSESAERIADSVTQGQPTAVREAARDAALDNGMSSLRGGKSPNAGFMRKSAQEAAGRAAGKQGESLDAPVGESEATKLDTTPAPEPRAENTELLSAMDKAIRTALPEREAAIISGVQAGRTMETIAAEHGISTQRVSQIVKAALPKLRAALEEAGFTKDDYVGGPGAMGPIEALEMKAARQDISITNADVNAMREREGSLRLMDEERKANPETWAKVEKHLDENPDYGSELVDSIRNGEKKSLTDEEQAALIHELATVKNARDAAAERAADPANDAATQADERAKWQKYEDRLNDTQLATKLAGTSAGRALQIRKMQISENFTYEGIARRERMVKGRGLYPEEDAAIKAKAAEIKAADEKVEEAQTKEMDAREAAEVDHAVEAAINYLGKEYLKKPSLSKRVLEIAKATVKRWESEAETASAELKRQLGGESGTIGGSGNAPGKGRKIGQQKPENKSSIVVNAAKVIRAKLSRFALDKAEVLEQMVSEYGPGIKPHFNSAWNAAANLFREEKVPTEVKEVLKKGQRKKGEKTETEAVAAAKAEKTTSGKLTPKIVGDVVKSIINDRDIHETDPLMRAAHEALKEQFPDATERDVRRAFVDYAHKTYPSQEAVKIEIAEHKQLVKIQEDIDREMQGLRGEIDPETGKLMGAEKQGFQRPKATQRVRELIKKRNEIIRKRADSLPPSPEKLAGQQEAIKTRLKNAIEDTDKRLKTGLKAAEREPVKYNAENEQLAAELQAMRDKLKEVEEAENPGKSEVDKQVDALAKVRDRLSDILSGKRPPNAPADWNPLSAAAEDLKAEILGMWELVAQLKRDAKLPTDPGAAAEKTKIRALEDAIREYEDKIAKGDFSTNGPKLGPDSAKVAALKEIRNARKATYDAAKNAGKPVLTLEERYNATRLKAIKKRIEMLEARKANDFTKTTKFSSPKLTRETLTAKAKADALKREVDMGIKEQELKQRPLWKKALSQLNQLRGIILGSDIGVLTRQGLFSWARPVTAIKATANALKAAVSPEAMGRWEAEVRDREINGELAEPIRKQAGLQTTDTLSHPEELVVTRLLSRIPDFKVGGKTVRLSAVGRTLERFQTTFINSVRADLFDAGIKKGYSPEELKDRASFINSVTGRSNVKHVPAALQAILTSPRYEISRWETLAAPISNLGKLARDGVKGKLNRAALANLQDMAVTTAGVLALFWVAQKAGGYQVNWNPTSTDFLKMRKGKDVWDVSAGLAPRLRDMARLFVALTHPDYYHNVGKILAGSVLRTINPAIKTPLEEGSIALQKHRGQTPKSPFSGFRTPDEQHGLISLAPIIAQSITQAIKEEGVGAGLWAGAREFIGGSVNRYYAPKE